MIDVAIAFLASVAMIVAPIWVLLWVYHYWKSRDTVDATSNTGATIFGGFVTVFAGFLVVGDQMVTALGFMGDVLAQFPNLIAYGVMSIGTWLGLSQLGEMDSGVALAISVGVLVLVIMIREGSDDDE